MERTRRKSSASEFFSRRNSNSLFQSMRRYSTSTMFGSTATTQSTANGDKVSDTGWGFIKKKGRRHSSSQLPISSSLNTAGSSDENTSKSLKKGALGDVAEHQESDDNDNSELIGRFD